MEMELEELQQLFGELRSLELGSLNAEHSKDEEDEELEYVPASADEDPLFLCLAAESRQRLIDAIEELPEKERLVLTLYYYEELTMREIGLTLGVVESRVSQIHSGAVRRLRSSLGQTTRRSDGQSQRSPVRSRRRASRRAA
jgi:RNA polymerase sigma factor for flagellar operon FliA